MKQIVGKSFSTNIYSEISVETLRKEYNKNVAEIFENKELKEGSLIYANYSTLASEEQNDYFRFYRGRLVEKHN